jgi:cation:H+ antiporter
METKTLLLILAGFALLALGGETLVRGAARLALALGVSPLVIGLTVVAWGTSAPEMAVSVLASRRGEAGLALGNVVGSNIFNVLFILGLSALIRPLVVARQFVHREVPVMVAVSLLLYLLALDARLSRLEGLLLLAGVAGYSALAVYFARSEGQAAEEDFERELAPGRGRQILLPLAFIAGGLLALVVGSRWLVSGAVTLARSLGVSDLLIGLTVVAAGTSLPEVATSVAATLRGQREIAVGNVIGSNIFNILAILGITVVVTPSGMPVPAPALSFDLPVMLAVAVGCLPIFFTGHCISRWEGLFFLFYYAAYAMFLILDASLHDALPLFSATMMGFVVPLGGITLLIFFYRAVRRRRRESAPGRS